MFFPGAKIGKKGEPGRAGAAMAIKIVDKYFSHK
jgi:hypothetical protein